jgi:hypothetical protein
LIFIGCTIGSDAAWRVVGTNRVIFTRVEFSAQEILKGNAGASIALQFLGGTVDDVSLTVADMPAFKAGDRVLLFVEGNGAQFCPLVGVYHGKFGLRKDETSGRDTVIMHNGKPLRDIANIGPGAAAGAGTKPTKLLAAPEREPMSVDDFKERIRSQLAKKTAQP